MAYITSEQVSAIRAQLKKEFPNFKFSVRKIDGMKVSITILKSDEDFSSFVGKSGYTQFHHTHETGFKSLSRIAEIARGTEWFDDSDTQTDYFNIAYYIGLSVGDWDRPWEHTAK